MHGILLGSGAFLCPVRRSSSVHPTLKLTLRINISRGAPDRYVGLSHLRYARRPEKHVATAKARLCKVAKRYECQFLTHILLPEQIARVKIDQMLKDSGWTVVPRDDFTPDAVNTQAVEGCI